MTMRQPGCLSACALRARFALPLAGQEPEFECHGPVAEHVASESWRLFGDPSGRTGPGGGKVFSLGSVDRTVRSLCGV